MIFPRTCKCLQISFQWHNEEHQNQGNQPRFGLVQIAWHALQQPVLYGMLCSDRWFFTYSLRRIICGGQCFKGLQHIMHLFMECMLFVEVCSSNKHFFNKTFLKSFRNACYCVKQTTQRTRQRVTQPELYELIPNILACLFFIRTSSTSINTCPCIDDSKQHACLH